MKSKPYVLSKSRSMKSSSQTANNGGGRFAGRDRGRYPADQFTNPNPNYPNPNLNYPNPNPNYSNHNPNYVNPNPNYINPNPDDSYYYFNHNPNYQLHYNPTQHVLAQQPFNYPAPNLNYLNPNPNFSNHDPNYVNPNHNYMNPNPYGSHYYFNHNPNYQSHYNTFQYVLAQQPSNYPAAQQHIPGSSFNMNHQFHPVTQQNPQAMAATYSPHFTATWYADSGGSHYVTNASQNIQNLPPFECPDQLTAAIEGVSINSVNSASEKKQAIIDETVNGRNFRYTHFISLPLASHLELVGKIANFRQSILGNVSCLNENTDTDSNGDEGSSDTKEVNQLSKANADVAIEHEVNDNSELVKVNLTNIPVASKSSTPSDLGIDESLFIRPETIHLTVLMLKLWNEERIKTASEVLQSISSKVMEALDNRPLLIRLKGLKSMNDSLAEAHVLYAPVEEIGSEGRLMRACQVIIDAYVEAGLVLENDVNRRLKLHATVMNSKFRKSNTWPSEPVPFDARGIFRQYGSEDWGVYPIREAHLSQRFPFPDNGYYHCCASIPFPENIQENDQ